MKITKATEFFFVLLRVLRGYMYKGEACSTQKCGA